MKRLIKIEISVLLLMLFSGTGITGEWQTIAPLNTPRAGAASVVWQNKIYVFGGKSLNNKILNTVERYDPARGEWDETVVPEFSEERYNASAILFDNKIFLIGGRGEEDVLSKVEVYDPAQNLWYDAQDLHEEREGFTAVILNNHIYVIGGQKKEHSMMDEIEWYDESKDKWVEVNEDMPHPRVAPFAAAVNDTFYMFGGYYFGLTKSFYKWKFKSDHSKWSAEPDLPTARAYGATVLRGDSLFLIGGEIQSGKTNMVEIFDLKKQKFIGGAPMNTARSGVTGVCLNDSIYAIGGYDRDSDEPLAVVEVYAEKLTAIDQSPSSLIPQSKTIINGYPNPFNGSITLNVAVNRIDYYEIALYNVLGKQIRTIYNGKLRNGQHRFQWRGRDEAGQEVASGVFFMVVKSVNQVTSYKIVYVK